MATLHFGDLLDLLINVAEESRIGIQHNHLPKSHVSFRTYESILSFTLSTLKAAVSNPALIILLMESFVSRMSCQLKMKPAKSQSLSHPSLSFSHTFDVCQLHSDHSRYVLLTYPCRSLSDFFHTVEHECFHLAAYLANELPHFTYDKISVCCGCSQQMSYLLLSQPSL
jgi:hypothetical protein